MSGFPRLDRRECPDRTPARAAAYHRAVVVDAETRRHFIGETFDPVDGMNAGAPAIR
jgi:hypothetical protein